MSEQNSNFHRLQEENKRLKRAVEELTILNDLARSISTSLNSDEIMHTVIKRSLHSMHCEQGVITLVQEDVKNPSKTIIRTNVTSSTHQQFHLHQALLGWMYLHKKPLLLNDVRTDKRFRAVHWDEDIRSILCVPLMLKSELKGILTVVNKKEAGGFTEDDQRLLAIISAQSIQIIENARLYEEEKALLQMKHDLMLASKIQLDLLPKCIPSIPGYEIAGSTIPAKTVGGDYYDFIQLDNYNWVLCIGDVTGKGLPASLLMANLQATIRGQTFKSTSPKECLTRANNLLFHSTDTDKFATLFYSKLNTQDHLITFSNAGHDMPLHFCTDCTIKRFETGGFMLGAFEDLEFDEETVSVSSGDTIVMYSDGITEAINPEEEFYGQRRLEQLVAEHKSFSAKELHDSILESVHMHTRGHPQSDDLTLIVLKRT